MVRAEEARTQRTLLQGGFAEGSRVLIRSSEADGLPEGAGGTLGRWRDDSAQWEVLLDDGLGTASLPASRLRLEALVLEERRAAQEIARPAAVPVNRARREPERLEPGAQVEVWHRGAWVDAFLLESTSELTRGHSRVALAADCSEVVVEEAHVRRKEGFQVRKRRQRACALAKQKLRDRGDRVTDADVLEVLRRWAFEPNTQRTNVLPAGKAFVYSDTFGLVNSRRSPSGTRSALTNAYPAMMKLISKWFKATAPRRLRDVPFTSVNVNFEYAARLHRDTRNAGPSIIRTLGEFTGGRLLYYPQDDRSLGLDELPRSERRPIDASRRWELFDGLRAHEVEDFEGERFSVILFSASSHASAKAPLRQSLRERGGACWPSSERLARAVALLPKPRGYKRPSAADGPRLAKRPRARSSAGVAPAPSAAPTGSPGLAAAGAKQAGAKKYRIVDFPHLGLKLTIQRVYTSKALMAKCRGDRAKLAALRIKLKDPSVFQLVED